MLRSVAKKKGPDIALYPGSACCGKRDFVLIMTYLLLQDLHMLKLSEAKRNQYDDLKSKGLHGAMNVFAYSTGLQDHTSAASASASSSSSCTNPPVEELYHLHEKFKRIRQKMGGEEDNTQGVDRARNCPGRQGP